MMILTGREFRANQGKYFGAAKNGEDVIVRSRIGSFRIVPLLKKGNLLRKNADSDWNDMLDSVNGAWAGEHSIPEDFRKSRVGKDEAELINILKS